MVYLITGNQQKVDLYTMLLSEYGISFGSQKCSLEELQTDSVKEISEYKAAQAFEQIGKPVFVQDAGWEIPALNGFPGPFMKYINQWLSPQDLLNLMKDKEDRAVHLVDYFSCANKEGEVSTFSATYQARFLDSAQGEGSSIDQVVALEGLDTPLSLTTYEQRVAIFKASPVWKELAGWIEENTD